MKASVNHFIEPRSTPLIHLVPVKSWISKRVRAREGGGKEAGGKEAGKGMGEGREREMVLL